MFSIYDGPCFSWLEDIGALMGNSVLAGLIERGPFRHAISLPRRRDRLHVMPTSTGYEIATGPTYDWDGRQRGHTPFSVLQHTGGNRTRAAEILGISREGLRTKLQRLQIPADPEPLP